MSRKAFPDNRLAAINAYFENGFNKEAAMRTAGYSLSTARKRPDIVFGRADVQGEISRRKKAMAKKHDLTQDWVIGRLMRNAMAGEILARFKVVQPDGSLMWDFTGATQEDLALVRNLGVEFVKAGRGENSVDVTKFKIQEPDEHAALMALSRHLGLFNDSLEVKGGSIIDRIRAGRARLNGPEAGEETPETAEETVH